MSIKMRFVCIILVVVQCVPAQAWLTGYSYRKSITVQDTNIDSNLTDFPLYVDVTADTDIGGGMTDTTNYYDFRITDSADSVVSYEVEYFDITTGTANAHIWAQCDPLATGGQTLYFYYGKSSDTDGSGDPWNANFLAVWHFGEASWNGTANEVVDSSGNAEHGTAASATVLASAKIGSGGDFGAGQVNVTNPSWSLADLTISCWNYVNSESADWDIIKSAITSNNALIVSRRYSLDRFQLYYGNGTSEDFAHVTPSVTTGTWEHWVVTKDNGNFEFFMNGASIATDIESDLNAVTGADLELWEDADVDGDELRVSNVVRSDAWIKFEHANMNESDNELTWGSEESQSVSTYYYLTIQ